MTEADQLRADLKAEFAKLFPRRNPEAMPIGDDVLALGVLLRREMRQAAKATLDSPQPRLPRRRPTEPPE
jgi:hypothetical protein